LWMRWWNVGLWRRGFSMFIVAVMKSTLPADEAGSWPRGVLSCTLHATFVWRTVLYLPSHLGVTADCRGRRNDDVFPFVLMEGVTTHAELIQITDVIVRCFSWNDQVCQICENETRILPLGPRRFAKRCLGVRAKILLLLRAAGW
jgi:hypothetical protein